MKRFFKAGFSSGTRFKRPASGYERRKEVMSLTNEAMLAEKDVAAQEMDSEERIHTFIGGGAQEPSNILKS